MREEDCFFEGGNWNESSHFKSNGFETITCEVEGSISFLGITITGSYKKGETYEMSWATYACERSAGNCCTKQGVFSGDEKLA